MARRRARKFTVEEKLKILEEARAPETTVSEVLRRHQLDTNTFYRWERQAKEGMRQALNGQAGRRRSQEKELERLREELQRKSQVIAEVVEENLALKRGL